MSMKNLGQELNVWRLLTHFWGILSAIFFLLDFFKLLNLSEALTSLTLIYISILSLFTTTKEVQRWKDKSFISNHSGEIFVIIWTGLMLTFISLTAYDPIKYSIPGEFNATYLGILAIFALSRKSRYLKIIKNNSNKK